MKTHKVKNIIRESDGNDLAVFTDGFNIHIPQECTKTLKPNMVVAEHINKNGTTVAYSWDGYMRFVGVQPMHYDESFKFIEDFKFFDRVRFNSAVMNVMHYRNTNHIFPNTEKFAHNLVLLGIKTTMRRQR